MGLQPPAQSSARVEQSPQGQMAVTQPLVRWGTVGRGLYLWKASEDRSWLLWDSSWSFSRRLFHLEMI